jgi:hypothetical protein
VEGTVDEARTGKRFPVELPIRIHIGDSVAEGAGTTSNVSVSGVYIKASDPQPTSPDGAPAATWRPGSEVEFDMTLPAAVIGAAEDVHIECRGRVVRVEKLPDDPRNGVACVIDKYEFVRKP